MEKLFVSGDYYSEAIIYHDKHMNKWDFYAQGYFHAAEMLIDSLDGKYPSVNDKLVYPICFLYRHFLELRLKEIIFYGSRLIDEPKNITKEDKLAHHKIEILWEKEVRPILQIIFPDGPIEDLDIVGEYIIQYIKIDNEESWCEEIDVDPTSFSFRYPYDIHGNPNLVGMNRINLMNLKKVMARLAAFSEGCSTAIAGVGAGASTSGDILVSKNGVNVVGSNEINVGPQVQVGLGWQGAVVWNVDSPKDYAGDYEAINISLK